MKQLGEAIPSLTTSGTSFGARQAEEPTADERAIEVWLSLTDIFGNGFITSAGKEPAGRWLNCINELSDEQIARGLHRLEYEDDDDRPPSLKRFRSACTYLHPIDAARQLPAPEYTNQDALQTAMSVGWAKHECEGRSEHELHEMWLQKRFGQTA
jgi:hypothetical protein